MLLYVTNALDNNDRTESLRKGEEITVLFDPEKPRRAVILDLYTSP